MRERVAEPEPTPALVVDLDVVERNPTRLASYARTHEIDGDISEMTVDVRGILV